MLYFLLKFYVPGFIKKQKLNELFRLTMDAFQCKCVDISSLSYEEGLMQYALTTKEQAEMYLNSGCSVKALKRRLFQNAYNWGRDLRKMLRVKSWKQANITMKELYKLIGIELCYNLQGEILIKHCYFSNYYSSDICRLISALDAGLAAGISGGGIYRFEYRITEGYKYCKGTFVRCPNEKSNRGGKRCGRCNGRQGAAREI